MAITFFDDSLAQFQLQQKASGRITEQTGTPGPYYGTKITAFECRQDDNGTFASTKTTAKRCEFYLQTATAGSVNGAVQWWAFSIVGVSGTVPTNGHTFRFQWHGPNGTGQPVVVINSLNGKVNVRLWDAGNSAQTNYPALTSTGASITFVNGTPYHFLNRIVHTTDRAQGLVEWWCNGVKFVEQNIQTIYTQTNTGAALTGSELRNYPKWGYYGSNDAGTIVTRVDGIRRGTSDESFDTMVAAFPVGSGYTGAAGGGALTVDFLSPASGATVTGRVDWRASATSAADVKFYVDNVLVLTDTSSPYGDATGFWDSTTVADGSRVLKVRATSAGGATIESTRTVTVDNVAAPPVTPDSPTADDKYQKTNTGSKSAGTKIVGTKTAGTRVTAASEAAAVVTFGTTAILDNFNRANVGPPPSSNWTTGIFSTDDGLKVVANECQGNGSTGNSGYWNVATFGPDCEVYVTLNNKGNDGSWCYLWARLQGQGTTTPSGYVLRVDPLAATDTLRLYRVDSGALTQIGSTYTEEIAVNDRVGLKCQGSTISAWKSAQSSAWSQVISTTDSTYASSGRIGLQSRGATQDFDDFGGGTL